MINIAVIFGGESSEHDVSIITGMQLIENVDETKYKIFPIYISENGDWYTGDSLFDLDNYKDNLKKIYKCSFVANDNGLYLCKGKKCKKIADIDVCVTCLHGVNGEDGKVAGILELSKIPYTSSDICCSSMCIDKSIFKTFCNGLGVSVIDGFSINRNDFIVDKKSVFDKIIDFGFPIILKPSRQGSSVGIEVCKNVDELENKLNNVFEYDSKILIEEFVSVKKEVNIALFADGNNIVFSNTEEPIMSCDILNFQDKYLDNSGLQSCRRIIPANISDECFFEIKKNAELVYRELEAFGVVRFDFIIDNDDNLFLNEVNTIPGSMANYLFDKHKYTYTKLIDALVDLSFLRNEKRIKYTAFKSDILSSGLQGLKK